MCFEPWFRYDNALEMRVETIKEKGNNKQLLNVKQ